MLLSSWRLLFSCSVVSDSLWPHGLQHARLPCPSLIPGPCSNSCPLSQWCHPAIWSSVVPFSSCLQSFPASGSFFFSSPKFLYLLILYFIYLFFLMSWLFTSGGQSTGASASAMNIASASNEYSALISFRIDRFDLLALQGILKSLLQQYCSKASTLQCSAFFMF